MPPSASASGSWAVQNRLQGCRPLLPRMAQLQLRLSHLDQALYLLQHPHTLTMVQATADPAVAAGVDEPESFSDML